MRILYIDIDSLRADHLGCYGYRRDTTPNIDALAREGARFTNCYVSDAPCLPSRTAFFWSRFGYRTGVVNHGGMRSQMVVPERGFSIKGEDTSLPFTLARAGFHTCSISSFMDRHSAYHVAHGFRETHDIGKHGDEIAAEVNAELAIPWLKRNAKRENWFLHLNYWDPHRAYRTPADYGNPFLKDPTPDWPDAETIQRHFLSYGHRSASEPLILGHLRREPTAREVGQIRNREDFRTWIDGYDTGIRYADDHIGQVLSLLREEGVWEDTAVIVSADHGESQGELNTYGDHMTADQSVARVPLIVRWPGLAKGVLCKELLYQMDVAPTLCELAGASIPALWDGRSFAAALQGGSWTGRPYLVCSQLAHTCQRSVRTGPWLMIRTYHPGLKPIPELLLFDVEKDPHETRDLAAEQPEVVSRCRAILQEWQEGFSGGARSCPDPMVTVLGEGGPYHAWGQREAYCQYLRGCGKGWAAEEVLRRNP